MQVTIWGVYICASLWACGIQVGRVLLFPSVTAVVIGWIGREVVANIISGVVIHLTQPFAQGDWVTMADGTIDGWVQDTGTFYTRVMQWDKRPIYVPNFKLMSMNVQNNSRMTHRRIIYDLPLRLRDIPKIPQIVRDMQEMVNSHEDIDPVQHRLVRWRGLGEYSAHVWLSCYTHPTMEGIRLGSYTAVQQSVLERTSQIIYKHGADFASVTDRLHLPDQESPKRLENVLADKLFESFGGSRESQLESREQVLRQREKEVKERERENEAEAEKLVQKAKTVQKAEEKYKQLMVAQRQRAEDLADQGASALQAESATERPEEPLALPAGDGLAPEGSMPPVVDVLGPGAAPTVDAVAVGAQLVAQGEEPSAAAAHEAGAPAAALEAGMQEVAPLPPQHHNEADGTLGAVSSGDGHGVTDNDYPTDSEQLGDNVEVNKADELVEAQVAKQKRIPVKEMGD
mmetsp:Transcript_8214/g.24942  ORF Transcript_8214/g.24942 Transcript_8214/m.24942 type:complete len:458 (+) Transcript_8214:1-1374(+)